jgi:hypothetical protein
MKPEADSPEDIRLNNLLARAAHAGRVTLAPGFSQRVLQSLPEQADAERSRPPATAARNARWASVLKIAASVAIAGLLWFANRPGQAPSSEEGWMSEFASGEFSASDLALIAQLHEVLEAEISTESSAAWIESGNR